MKLKHVYSATLATSLLIGCGGGNDASNPGGEASDMLPHVPPPVEQCDAPTGTSSTDKALAALGITSEPLTVMPMMVTRPVAEPEERITSFVVQYYGEDTGRAHILSAKTREDRMKALNTAFEKDGKTFAMVRAMTTGHQLIAVIDDRPMTRAQADAMARKMQAADPRIATIDPNISIHPMSTVPQGPMYFTKPDFTQGFSQDELWHLKAIKAPETWTLMESMTPPIKLADQVNGTRQAAGPMIGIIDTGFIPHVDLVRNVRNFAKDTYDKDNDPYDYGDSRNQGECTTNPNSPYYKEVKYNSQHGLNIEGLISAFGAAKGVFPGVGVVHARYHSRCGGDYASYLEGNKSLVDFRKPDGRALDVINMSNGGAGACLASMQALINEGIANNTVFVASAGNDPTKSASQTQPANCTYVISAGATNIRGEYTAYTAKGADVYAPGGGSGVDNATGQGEGSGGLIAPSHKDASGYISRCMPGNIYNLIAGTSFSAPMISSVAAAMRSVNPDLSAKDIKPLIILTRQAPTRLGAPSTLDMSRAVSTAKQLRGPAAAAKGAPICKDQAPYAEVTCKLD